MRKISFTTATVVLTLTLLWVAGCCSFNSMRMLEKVKAQAQRKEYATIARLEVKCDPACDGCNQLHLIKGDACFRLAKQGNAAEQYYPCAIAELDLGIRLTRQWQQGELNRSLTYINLLEAIRNRRDLLTGAEAHAANEKLLKTAKELLAAEPQNPCGIYYEINARYAKQHRCLLDPSNCPTLCTDLQEMRARIEKGLSLSVENICAPNLKQQKKEIMQAGRIANCP